MLFIDRAHQRGSRREHLIHKDKDGLLRRELDAFTNDIDELSTVTTPERFSLCWANSTVGLTRSDQRERGISSCL